jgi:hypothetical protein
MDTLTHNQDEQVQELAREVGKFHVQLIDCRSAEELEPIAANLRYLADQLESIERRDSRG